MKKIYTIILAGGKGKRLWPFSRIRQPKQFLSFFKTETLIQTTVERFNQIVPESQQIIVAVAEQKEMVERSLSKFTGHIIYEPSTRNTAAATFLGCKYLEQLSPHAVVIISPSDHIIKNKKKFTHIMHQASKMAIITNKIILVGIYPSFASTHYGYIEYEPKIDTTSPIYIIKKFHEKPDKANAQKLLDATNVVWNSGIIISTLKTLLKEFSDHAPEILHNINEYQTIPSISIDRAILEKTKNIQLMIGDFDWSDIGTLESFVNTSNDYQMKKDHRTTVSVLNAKNNIAYTKKTVIFSGVDNIGIIDAGDILLVTQRKHMEDISTTVNQLKDLGLEEYM